MSTNKWLINVFMQYWFFFLSGRRWLCVLPLWMESWPCLFLNASLQPCDIRVYRYMFVHWLCTGCIVEVILEVATLRSHLFRDHSSRTDSFVHSVWHRTTYSAPRMVGDSEKAARWYMVMFHSNKSTAAIEIRNHCKRNGKKELETMNMIITKSPKLSKSPNQCS